MACSFINHLICINHLVCIINLHLRDLNSFPASGKFCYLLITFANSLDPDQA